MATTPTTTTDAVDVLPPGPADIFIAKVNRAFDQTGRGILTIEDLRRFVMLEALMMVITLTDKEGLVA